MATDKLHISATTPARRPPAPCFPSAVFVCLNAEFRRDHSLFCMPAGSVGLNPTQRFERGEVILQRYGA
jgi:hypothetical protein